MGRGGSEDASLLGLELVDLLLTVHGDDERNDEDEEGGSDDPRGLAGAAEELLGDEGGVGDRFLGVADDGGFRNPREGKALLTLIRHRNYKVSLRV